MNSGTMEAPSFVDATTKLKSMCEHETRGKEAGALKGVQFKPAAQAPALKSNLNYS